MDTNSLAGPEEGKSSSSGPLGNTTNVIKTKAEESSFTVMTKNVNPQLEQQLNIEKTIPNLDLNFCDTNEDEYGYASDDYLDLQLPPRGKRLAPVGADAETPESSMFDVFGGNTDSEKKTMMVTSPSDFDNGHELKRRIFEMEEEQEELNTSLMSITSHFAKVQLRLQQVVSAPQDKREELLKELEHFAFRGVPDLTSPRMFSEPSEKIRKSHVSGGKSETDSNNDFDSDLEEKNERKGENESKQGQGKQQQQLESNYSSMVSEEILEAQRKKHTDLIHQLKVQLNELENYAYESGEGIIPSNLLLERQRVVMEQLKSRLNLNMDNIAKLSEEELKAEVDSAVGQIVNPLKMKNHLVDQLQTQINDLEMFIQFLQSENSIIVPNDCQDCGCNKHNSPTHTSAKSSKGRKSKFKSRSKSEQEEIHKQTMSILQKAIAVLQLTAISQFGCGRDQFYKNTLKRTTKGNHYGDLRAKLELSIDHLLEACSQTDTVSELDTDSVTSTGIESHSEYLVSSPVVTAVVRREVATALRDLMQHGLSQRSRNASMVPFMGCMSARSSASTATNNSSSSSNSLHAWDVIVKFYQLKQGHEFNSAPQRKLSSSFGLDLAGASSSSKQSLLSTVGEILNTHGLYKRSADAHFKAFVCAGLRKRKLITWLKLILRNQTILELYYQPWSYVGKTGFDDGFKALDRLSMYVFDLPVDVAVKQFQDMREAF